jgi:nucleoid DNA-binding protein
MDDADIAEKPDTRKKRQPAKAPALAIVPPPAEPSEETSAKVVTRRVLVDRVQVATGAKKKAVRDIVEATLQALGEALTAGETLNVPPLGRLTVKREGKGAGAAMTIKVKRGAKKGEEGLAEADEAE